jgi:hypothetical protein
MIRTSLRTNSLTEAGFAWYAAFVDAFERREAAAVQSYLHEEAVFELNNFLPFYGKRTVLMALERFWEGVEAIEHEAINIYGHDRRFSAELLAHYMRRDGVRVTVPMAAFYDRDTAGQLLSMRTFIDLQPVFDD